MKLLLIGLFLWSGAHLFQRLAPRRRASMGARAKGIVAIVSVLGVLAMIVGYRSWESAQVWNPPAAMTQVNNILMVLAVYFFAASGMKTRLSGRVRHMQLTGVKIWAVAHLLVNGDLASIVLFGGLLAWAVVSVIAINRAEPNWLRPEPAPIGKEIGAVVGAVLAAVAIGYVHTFFNLLPFGD